VTKPSSRPLRDRRMTANVYGHLSTDYLRAEIDRLRFNPVTDFDEGAAERRVPRMSPSPEKWPTRAREASAHRAGTVHASESEEYGT